MGVARWTVLWVALILLSCMPAFAQEDTEEGDPSGNQYEAENGGTGALGPDSECPGAEVVNTTTGTGPKQSPPFRITGERFRITITNVATSQDPSLSGVSVFVNEANGDPAGDFSQEGPGTDSSIINAGPGDFFIETNPANSEYTIVVEDCVDTEGNPPANAPGDPGDPDDVVPGTGGDKPLPNTGGVPVLFGAAALALASALLARRILAP